MANLSLLSGGAAEAFGLPRGLPLRPVSLGRPLPLALASSEPLAESEQQRRTDSPFFFFYKFNDNQKLFFLLTHIHQVLLPLSRVAC